MNYLVAAPPFSKAFALMGKNFPPTRGLKIRVLDKINPNYVGLFRCRNRTVTDLFRRQNIMSSICGLMPRHTKKYSCPEVITLERDDRRIFSFSLSAPGVLADA